MITGIILAAGKGTRFGSTDTNKVVSKVLNTPLVVYAVDVLTPFVDQLCVVVGHKAQSVKGALVGKRVEYALQRKRLGSGHAVKCALELILSNSKNVIIGYADAMALYKKSLVEKLIKQHTRNNATLTLVTSVVPEPGRLGRIVHNSTGKIVRNVEYRDASEEERAIKTVNIGFYCVDAQFLHENLPKLKKSPVSGEYYLTDLIGMCYELGGAICEVSTEYGEVGVGVNTKEDLQETEKLLKQRAR